MKTSRNIISAIIAAGSPVVAVLAIAGLVPADIALGVLTVASIAAFAVFDFSRTRKPYEPRLNVLRPTLPAAGSNAPVSCYVRRAA